MKTKKTRIASAVAAVMLAIMMLTSGCAIVPVDVRTDIKVQGHWKDPETKKECIAGGGSECELVVQVPVRLP